MYREIRASKSEQSLKPLIDEISFSISDKPLIGFCGGTSITPVLKAFASHLDDRSDSPFSSSNIMLIDERLVPSDHNDSNSLVLREGLGEKASQLSIMEFNTSDPSAGLSEYSDVLFSKGGYFDLVFLGVGEDAHVAGLFPNFPWEDDFGEPFFTFNNSPKPPSGRMSVSPHVLSASKNIVLLFFGEGKREAYERFLAGDEEVEDCPVLLAKGAENLWVVTDLE